MMHFRSLFVLLSLVATLGFPFHYGLAQSADRTVTHSLERVSVDTSAYIPGRNVNSEIPTSAYAFNVDSQPLADSRFLLFDLDGDGSITSEVDGIAMGKFPFVVPLPEKLLLPSGQGRVSVEGSTLTLRMEELDIRSKLVREASFLTNLRIRAAVRPVFLSDTASRHARSHIEYLDKNDSGEGEGVKSLSVHDQKPGNPGYTKEGAKAARNSIHVGGRESFIDALWEWYRTPFHGQSLIDPFLRSVGIALGSDHVLLYPYKNADQETVEPYVYPPDGASHVPFEFPGRETPDPNVQRGPHGTPIYVYIPPKLFRDRHNTISAGTVMLHESHEGAHDEKCRTVVRGPQMQKNYSSPSKPLRSVRDAHNRGFYEGPIRNLNMIVYIPEEPLKPNTKYEVLLFSNLFGNPNKNNPKGMKKVWSFRTSPSTSGQAVTK